MLHRRDAENAEKAQRRVSFHLFIYFVQRIFKLATLPTILPLVVVPMEQANPDRRVSLAHSCSQAVRECCRLDANLIRTNTAPSGDLCNVRHRQTVGY